MAYLNLDNNKFEEDLISRKEFIENEYILNDYKTSNTELNYLDKEIKENRLELTNYQKFVTNFINPNTHFDKLLLIHSTGVGKTITALSTAINFINIFKQEKLIDNSNDGMIFIIGFTKNVFKKELFSRKEFGIVNQKEIDEMNEYKKRILQYNDSNDIIKLKELKMKYSTRLKSKKGNGYFEFIGYKELVNRLIIKNQLDIKLQLNNIKSEKELDYLIKQDLIKLNHEFLEKFHKSLIICDEIHNVYNSLNINNWGIALNIIFKYYEVKKSLRVLFLSATPINNNPIEIMSLLNLLNTNINITKNDIFNKNNELTNSGKNIIKKLILGKISYLKDMDITSYPQKEIHGEMINSIPYLKFIKCPMSDLHFKTYERVSQEYIDNRSEKNIKYSNINNLLDENDNINIEEINEEMNNINKQLNKFPINLELENRFLNDFILPNPNNNSRGLYLKAEIIKEIQNAPNDWKDKYEINLVKNEKLLKNTITGNILLETNIKKYSNKIYQMLQIIKNIIMNNTGKIFIYHNFIQVSGINLIAEVLRINGILLLDDPITKNSKCNICYKKRDEIHNNHDFKPIRFFMVSSHIHKNIIDKQLDSFNLNTNINGEEIRIVLGSKAIKESYNLKAIQNLLILHQPDNISTLIQIFGRAIRKNSHQYLPIDNRKVNIYILISTIPEYIHKKYKKYVYSYEEMKYKYKLEIYKIIQKISDIFIENAIDRNINYNLNFPKYDMLNNNDLYYINPIKTNQLVKIDYNNINLSTFQSYYYQDEINHCKYIIKRLFIEKSKVWKYDDLILNINEFCLNNTNNKYISEHSIIIALDFLVYNTNNNHITTHSQIQYNAELENQLLISNLFNYDEKIIIDLANKQNIIVYINEYYILIPLSNSNINNINNNIEYDAIYNNFEYIPSKKISIKNLIDSDIELNNFDYIKTVFINKYLNKKINKLIHIISEYDFKFHLKMIEEIIEYFFNLYTNNDYNIHIHHDFYLKLLYFYNKFNIIIFANKMDTDLQEIYGKYILSTSILNFTVSDNKSENYNYNNLLNQLSTESQSSSNNNNEEFYFNFYNQAVNDVSNYLLTRKQNKIFDYLLPIGHIYDQNFKFYHPNKYWFNKLDYNKLNINYIENSKIIGYLEKTKLGFDIMFKLRNPKIKNNKIKNDLRNVETGLNCLYKDKGDLIKICKLLDIDINNIILRKNKLCNLIKNELINRELSERKKMSNIKYFYFYWEINN